LGLPHYILKDRNMKTKVLLIAGLLSLSLLGCKDDGEISASIVGKWQSDKADFNLNPSGPIPGYTITRDDFSIQTQFNSDGSVVLTDENGVSTTGSYTMTGTKLTLNINYDIEFISLSGTYTIDELTDTRLIAVIKKEDTFTDPDSGQEFEGEITVTLYFDRI
jgi:hypothetical protein